MKASPFPPAIRKERTASLAHPPSGQARKWGKWQKRGKEAKKCSCRRVMPRRALRGATHAWKKENEISQAFFSPFWVEEETVFFSYHYTCPLSIFFLFCLEIERKRTHPSFVRRQLYVFNPFQCSIWLGMKRQQEMEIGSRKLVWERKAAVTLAPSLSP